MQNLTNALRSSAIKAPVLASVLSAFLFSSCFRTSGILSQIEDPNAGQDVASESNVGDFPGCISAEALDSSRIRVTFQMPPGAIQMNIYRGPDRIHFTYSATDTAFEDNSDLLEGHSYTYRCEALIDSELLMGMNVVTATTKIFNPPSFSGIGSASPIVASSLPNNSAVSVRINWPSAATQNAVPVSYYKVYATLGSTVNWNAPPRIERLPATTLETTLTDLGDELPYAFGVRACTSNDICDTNTKKVSLTLHDTGMASNAGIDTASKGNQGVIVHLPWQESYGAVKKRRVFYKEGVCSTNLNDYTVGPVVDVSVTSPDLTNPPQEALVTGLQEDTTYVFLAKDEDVHQTLSTNFHCVTQFTGDLTPPPNFHGIDSVAPGTDPETEAVATWTAIPSQRPNPNGQSDPTGANAYLLLMSSAPEGEALPNACEKGTQFDQDIPAESYVPNAVVSFPITGLTKRTQYSVCVKARDLDGNLTDTVAPIPMVTKDVTPPEDFDGVQSGSYDPSAQELLLVWAPSYVPDIKEYIVRIWKNRGSAAELTLDNYDLKLPVAHVADPMTSGVTIHSPADLVLNSGDRVFVHVVACDNASPTYNSDDNCTPIPLVNAVSVAIP